MPLPEILPGFPRPEKQAVEEPLSEEEEKALVNLLGRLKPGGIPATIWHEFTRLNIVVAVEVALIKPDVHGKPQILLLRRTPDDPAWANLFAMPGSVIRPGDNLENLKDPLARVFAEVPGLRIVDGPHSSELFFQDTERGRELVFSFWAQVNGQPQTGEFFAFDQLPADLIPSQVPRIQRLKTHFYPFV